MKSLAESILSSTNSGKSRIIDVEYLLNHGFEPVTSYGNPKTMFRHKETGYTLRVFRDKIVLYIFKDENVSAKKSEKKLVVSTIGDLDLVIKWFKSWEYNDSDSEKEKLRNEIFKRLKEI